MLSQSPTGEEATPEYSDAWGTTQYLVYHQGGSLSGREWNRTYLNVGPGRFADVTALARLDSTGDGRAIATCDWDGDGALDLFLKSRTGPRLQFFRNRMQSGRFVSVSLVGVTCNKEAVGAKVTVEVGDRTLRQTVYAGDGFLSQSTRRLHFGLGDAERIRGLSVVWPDGTRSSFEDLAVDAHYEIVQGQDAPRALTPPKATALAAATPRTVEGIDRSSGRIVLLEKLPLGELVIPAFERPDRRVRELSGSPVLLNLWASTCASCLAELGEFSERSQELERSGLRIVTMSTDEPETMPDAHEHLARLGFEDGAGLVDERLRAALPLLLGAVVGEIGGHGKWSLPMSLLLDERGQLAAIYAGRVGVETLLADVAALDGMDPGQLDDTDLLPGFRLTRHRRNLKKLGKSLQKIGAEDLGTALIELR